MKFKSIYLILICLFFFSLNSCVFSVSGDSLHSFSQRMNEYNENYNMSSNGYIIGSSDSSFTKFFKFSEEEIMLKFRHDENNRLTEMHIVFDYAILEETSEPYIFITDCIKSFCQDESVAEQLFDSTDFENAVKTVQKNTISAEVGNIKTEIDTTQLGTVISLYKDI